MSGSVLPHPYLLLVIDPRLRDRCQPFVRTKTADQLLKKADHKQLQLRSTRNLKNSPGPDTLTLSELLSMRCLRACENQGPPQTGDL